jgi:hypothetical protein
MWAHNDRAELFKVTLALPLFVVDVRIQRKAKQTPLQRDLLYSSIL